MACVGDEAQRSSVVFLLGEGGCGKSVLSLQYLSEQSRSQVGVSVLAECASEVEVVTAFNRLRSPSSHCRPDLLLNQVVRRLRTANPDAERVLLVAIDGLEEHWEQSIAQIRALIHSCWGEGNPARSGVGLLISCRSRSDLPGSVEGELIARCFDSEDPAAMLGQVGFVFITEFNNEEMAEAVRGLDGESERMLAQFLFAGERLPPTSTSSPPLPDAVSRSVLDSLRHPVVWGAFASLPEADRCQILGADPTALDRLADKFLERFGRKCRNRRHEFDDDLLHAALNAVSCGAGHRSSCLQVHHAYHDSDLSVLPSRMKLDHPCQSC